MRKFLLIALAAFALANCSKNDDDASGGTVVETFPEDVPSATGTAQCYSTSGGGYGTKFENASSTKLYVKIGYDVKAINTNSSVDCNSNGASVSFKYAPSDLVQIVAVSEKGLVKFIASNATAKGTIKITNNNLLANGKTINGGTANITKVVITDIKTNKVVITNTSEISTTLPKTFSVQGGSNYQIEVTKNGVTYKIGTGIQMQQRFGADLGYLPLYNGGKASIRFAVDSYGKACLGFFIE